MEQKKILADPALQNGFEFYDMTREEQMYSWMKKLNHLWFNKPKQRASYFQQSYNPRFYWVYFHKGQCPTALHLSMFSQSLETFANDKQKEKWLPRLNNFDIWGCYCQTEMGHGSDVASLETTATYDKKND